MTLGFFSISCRGFVPAVNANFVKERGRELGLLEVLFFLLKSVCCSMIIGLTFLPLVFLKLRFFFFFFFA